MSANNKKPNGSSGPHRHPEHDTPLPREQLPQSLQTLVDDDDSLLDQLYEGRLASLFHFSLLNPFLYFSLNPSQT